MKKLNKLFKTGLSPTKKALSALLPKSPKLHIVFAFKSITRSITMPLKLIAIIPLSIIILNSSAMAKNPFGLFPGIPTFKSSNVSSNQLNQTYLYSANKEPKLHIEIAEGMPSRIEFGMFGFKEIIGDESKYSFLTDHSNKSIFITPKVNAGESISLSLVNNIGEIIDLKLLVKKIEGQVIKIDRKIQDLRKENNSEYFEIISMIKALKRDINQRGKYWVKYENRNIHNPLNMAAKRSHNSYLVTNQFQTESTVTNLLVIQDRTYKCCGLIGVRLKVTNKSSELIELDQSDFKNIFEYPLAITFSQKVLRPKEIGTVYMVFKEKSDD